MLLFSKSQGDLKRKAEVYIRGLLTYITNAIQEVSMKYVFISLRLLYYENVPI